MMNSTEHTNTTQGGNLFSKKGLLAFMAGLMISLSATAGGRGETPAHTEAISASRIIREHVKFPELLIPAGTEEKVNVVFTVNEAGHVNLVVANTDNRALRRSIEEQFATLSLRQLKANHAYSIQFNFKTL